MPECHSTNTHALQLCQQTQVAPEGTVVITDNQTAGRGQRGNKWITASGKNFTFSMLFKPTFLMLKDQFFLTIFISLSISDYLRKKGCDSVQIKWPNDIYTSSKKICGILIENVVAGDRFSNVVIGVGLNVNQDKFDVETATSMRMELGQTFDLTAELEVLLTFIEARYLKLRGNELQSLLMEYLSHMYWRSETHVFSDNNGLFEGTIIGIDESGRLAVGVNGRQKTFDVKEITYVR